MADVQNSAFLVSAATIMIGQYGTDVFSLTPAEHSVGMVKNTKVSMESSTLDLTNGVQQNLVDSLKSGVKMSLGFEGYEFSAANLKLALGIGGSTLQYRRGRLTTALAGAGVTLSISSAPVPGEPLTAITGIGDLPAGTLLLLQDPVQPDKVWPAMTSGPATGSAGGPFTVTVPAAPANMAFPIGTLVWVANQLDLGSQAPLDYFCVKMAGTMTSNGRPVVGIFPKVKITKGFDMSLSDTAYANLPFEITPYFLSGSEVTGRLAEIGTRLQGRMYIAG